MKTKQLSSEDLAKAYQILSKIEKIKGQILTIETLADQIANNDTTVDFSLKIPEKSVPTENYKNTGDFKSSNAPVGIKVSKKSNFFDMVSESLKSTIINEFQDSENKLSLKIKDTEALSVLGIILRERFKEIAALKNELRDLGINIINN